MRNMIGIKIGCGVMNKKIMVIIIVLLCVLLIVLGFWFTNKEDNYVNRDKNYGLEDNEGSVEEVKDKKSLVLYFSATGNTKEVANKISEVVKGDVLEIIPEVRYSSSDLNYNDDNSRANREQNDSDSRPLIDNDINVDDYDVIFLGFPIWWSDVPKIILTFMESYDLKNKIIIPFCTSGGSGIETSVNTLRSYDTNVKMVKD